MYLNFKRWTKYRENILNCRSTAYFEWRCRSQISEGLANELAWLWEAIDLHIENVWLSCCCLELLKSTELRPQKINSFVLYVNDTYTALNNTTVHFAAIFQHARAETIYFSPYYNTHSNAGNETASDRWITQKPMCVCVYIVPL